MAYQRRPILWVKIAVSKTGTLTLRLKLHPKMFPHLSALQGVNALFLGFNTFSSIAGVC